MLKKLLNTNTNFRHENGRFITRAQPRILILGLIHTIISLKVFLLPFGVKLLFFFYP